MFVGRGSDAIVVSFGELMTGDDGTDIGDRLRRRAIDHQRKIIHISIISTFASRSVP